MTRKQAQKHMVRELYRLNRSYGSKLKLHSFKAPYWCIVTGDNEQEYVILSPAVDDIRQMIMFLHGYEYARYGY